MEAARAMIPSKNLPFKFWAEAVNTAVYGTTVYVHIPKKKKKKWNKKAKKGILDGFCEETKKVIVFEYLRSEKSKFQETCVQTNRKFLVRIDEQCQLIWSLDMHSYR